jgi:6-phosphogluconolactonase
MRHSIVCLTWMFLAAGCAPAGDGGNTSPQGGSGGSSGGAGGQSAGGSGGRGGTAGGGASGGNSSGGSGGSAGAAGSGGAGGSNASGGSGGAGGSGGGAGTGGTGGSGGAGGAGGSGGASGAPGDGPREASSGTDGPANPMPIAGKGLVVAAASFGGSTLTSFSFDFGTGALTRMGGGTPGGSTATYVAFHPGGKFLFVNNEVGSGRATAMSVGTDGALTRLNDASSGGSGPCHIWVHKTGKWLLTANYSDGRVGVLPIGDDGRLGATVSSPTAGGNAHMALDDGQSGNFVFVVAAAAGHVAQFKLDSATGMLTANSPATVAISQRPRHMAFNPNGRFAYVTHESRTALTTFNYDSNTGLLSGPRDTPTPNDGAHVLAHPSGKFVYHIARGGNAVSGFTVGADGSLTMIERLGSGGYDGTISKDGRYLLVVSGSSLRVYAIDGATGKLTAGATGQALGNSQSVTITAL